MYSSRIIDCAIACVILWNGQRTHAFNSTDSLRGTYGVNASFDVSRKEGSVSVRLDETRPSFSPTKDNVPSFSSTPSPTVFASLRPSKPIALIQFEAQTIPSPLLATTLSPSAAPWDKDQMENSSVYSTLSPVAESGILVPTLGENGTEIVVPTKDPINDANTNTETTVSTSEPISSLTQAPSPNPTGTLSPTQTFVSEQTTETSPSIEPSNSVNRDDNLTPSVSDVDLEPLQFYRNRLFQVTCSVFFPTATVLSGQEVNTFERTAKDFVMDHVDKIDLPVVVVSVNDVTVVSQVFAWTRPQRLRVLEGIATGLNVYFQIDAVVTGYTTIQEFESSIQELFDTYESVFLNSLDFSSANNPDRNTFYPVRIMLGIVAGCSGFVALAVATTMFVRKRKREIKQASNRKPKLGSDKEISKLDHKPVQYAIQELSQRERAAPFRWDEVRQFQYS